MDQYKIVPAGTRDAVPYVNPDGGRATHEIDTFAALKRRRVLIALLVLAATALAFLATRLMTPLYEAEAGIMFNARELTPMGAAVQQSTLLPSEETARKNEIAIIRSRGLAEAVVERLSLDRVAEFNPTLRPPSGLRAFIDNARATLTTWVEPALAFMPSADAPQTAEDLSPERVRDEIINRFLSRVETTSSDASRVIGIRFLSEDRERAALVANLIADQFMIQKRDEEVRAAETLARNLTAEIAKLNRDIHESERTFEDMRLRLGIEPDTNTRSLSERMSELNRQLIAATAERLRAEAQFAEAKQVRETGDVAAAAQVLNSSLVQRLQEMAAAASARVQQLSVRYADSHPRLVEARSELRDIRGRIAEEMAKIQTSRFNAVAIGKANEEGLRRQIEALKDQMTRVNASEVDSRVAEREMEAKRTLLPQLTARLNNANAQIDYLKLHGADVNVISRAVVPRKVTHPPVAAIVATAFILSTAIGAILAVILERADHSIQSLTQLRHMTPLRVLGTLPTVRFRRWRRAKPADEVLEERDSLFLEHLRSIALRAGVAGPNPAKVLLITSSVSNEGKSSLASSMARMLSLSGRRTIVLDADLRAPTMHRVFDLQRGPGLAEFLTEDRPLQEVIQHDVSSGTDVLTAGQSLAAPGDVLQSARMQELIGDLVVQYDTVIIDSPPVLAVCDAHILARLADRTIMLARWRSTRATTLMTALHRLSDDRVPVDGLVLSQVDGRKYKLYADADADIFSRGFRKYYVR